MSYRSVLRLKHYLSSNVYGHEMCSSDRHWNCENMSHRKKFQQQTRNEHLPRKILTQQQFRQLIQSQDARALIVVEPPNSFQRRENERQDLNIRSLCFA